MTKWIDFEIKPARLNEMSFSRRKLLAATGAAAISGLVGLPFAKAFAQTDAPAPVRGGRLRVGTQGRGASDSLNFNRASTQLEVALAHQVYEGLVDYTPEGKLMNRLATEFSANSDATKWRIKLRSGVTFHNGKEFTSEDVIASFAYMMDAANRAQGFATLNLAGLQAKELRADGKDALEVTLKAPNSLFPTLLSNRTIKMFPAGMTTDQLENTPVGTGPFAFVDWQRGQSIHLKRNDEYWLENRPYLDELVLLGIGDTTAKLNGLLSGQIDAIDQLSAAAVPTIAANPALRLIEKKQGATYNDIFMRVDTAPYDDKRVRLAFKYLIDRQQMIKVALGGHGYLANDLPCFFDEDYAADIPQREYDPDRARSLMKEAGHSSTEFVHTTADTDTGILSSSTLLVEQAKRAGVNVRLNVVPPDQFYSKEWLNAPFGQASWGGRSLISNIAEGFLSSSNDNESHWKSPAFDNTVASALKEIDPARRKQYLADAQRMLWDDGGYIIYAFRSLLDATSSKVHGITPSVIRGLGDFNFREAFIAP